MKSINSIQRNIILFLALFVAITSFSSCFQHYYKTNTANQTDTATLQHLVNEKKYFILHSATNKMALNNVHITNENLEADVTYIPAVHQPYLNPKNETGNKFHVNHKKIVDFEVHLYTADTLTANPHINMPVKNFYRVDVYDLDKEATNSSKVLSITGITLGAAAIVVTVVSAINAVNNMTFDIAGPPGGAGSATPSSGGAGTCSPQVYCRNGSTNELKGILFSGAIFAPLQRTDYVPLHLIKNTDTLHLQIKSGANEELYVKQAKLLQVTHPKNTKVLLDGSGKVIAYKKPILPEHAYTGFNEEMKKEIAYADEKYYSFTNTTSNRNNSDIILDFKKPAGVDTGKLILRARNSAWALYVFKKYKSLYGEYYPSLLALKDKGNHEKLMQCEIDQSLPLLVSVKDGNEWKSVGYFHTPGNVVARDMIMEIDLKRFKNTDHIQVKLETAYMFWELDYAAMDFSKNSSCTVNYINPVVTSKSGDLLPQLNEQTNITLTDKDDLTMDYISKPVAEANLTNSFFLQGSGYYHDNTIFEGKAQTETLLMFSKKGGFDKYSRQTFEQLLIAARNQPVKDIPAGN